MPRFRVHVYPVMRVEIEVVADSPQDAANRAADEVQRSITEAQSPLGTLHYADDIGDSVIVDCLDTGEYLGEFPV